MPQLGSTFAWVDVENEKFDVAIRKFVTDLGLAAPDVVKEETRLLLAQCIKFMPPKTYSQGRKAVSRDIKRSMASLDETRFRSKRIANLIRKNDVNAVREIVRRCPAMRDFDVQEFDPQKLHEDKRDNRGRIRKFQKILVLKRGKVKSYIRARQRSVGSAKAGFWPGLQAVGGAVPAYIAKHASKYGSVDISKLASKTDSQVRITNYSKAAVSDNEFEHVVESAVKMRGRSMESKFRRMVKEKAEAAGLSAHE